jgi:hypothetical protein
VSSWGSRPPSPPRSASTCMHPITPRIQVIHRLLRGEVRFTLLAYCSGSSSLVMNFLLPGGFSSPSPACVDQFIWANLSLLFQKLKKHDWRRRRKTRTELRCYPDALADDDVTAEQTCASGAFPRRWLLRCDGSAAAGGEERRSCLGHGWVGVHHSRMHVT